MKDYNRPYALAKVRPHYDYNRLYGSNALTCAESFLARRGRFRPYIYWCALLIVTAFLAALPLVHIDLTVQELGRVRPATERSTIVARTGGFIASLKVKDNDLVQAGQTLAVLNTNALDAKFALNAEQTKLRERELADLDTLIAAVDAKRAAYNLQTAEYIAQYQQFLPPCTTPSLG
jgi:membrane fusion protein, peptide pheromone/bacteriocin exporter